MLHGSYQFGVIKQTTTSTYYNYPYYNNISYKESDNVSRSHNFFIGCGPVFILTPSVSLEVILGHTLQKYTTSDYRISSFVTGLGFQVHLGRGKTKAEKSTP